MNAVWLTCGVALIGLQVAWAQAPTGPPALVPQAARLEPLPEEFALTRATPIVPAGPDEELGGIGRYAAEVLGATLGGGPLAVRAAGEDPRHPVRLSLDAALAALGEEGYQLRITPDGIFIAAPRARGVFYGVQTLRQLLPPVAAGAPPGAVALPGLHITDAPRYRWRGMLLDCGRHFMDKAFVKRYIDLLAYHKLNVLHWHLTEDQGWRIEIRRYPRLTQVGAWRAVTRDSERDPGVAARPAAETGPARYGGFYTQADIREIVAYAASRHVTVVPEIEMPGHCLAALASYPELSCTGGPFEVGTVWGVYEDVYCAGNERTFEFLEHVLDEVLELFPSPYVHIGGDEVPKTRWQACPRCQERMRSEGLKDTHQLQSYFIRRIERFLNARGRRLIGWDEILEGGLAPNATVQSWRGMDGALAAARAGHDVIASPTSHCYLDYPQVPNPAAPEWMGFITLEKAYAFEPTPAELTPAEAAHVLGGEGNIWTERAPPARVDEQVFPRLCALAEVFWSPAPARQWADFAGRMPVHLRRLDALGVRYFRAEPATRPAP